MTSAFCMTGYAAADARYLNSGALPGLGVGGANLWGIFGRPNWAYEERDTIKMAGRAENGRQA